MAVDMFRLKSIQFDMTKALKKRGLDENGEVQRYIDTECLKLCAPKVPKDNNILISSGNIHTKIGSGQLEYRTVYARRWYYREANFQGAPERGNYWFERMKQQYKKHIIEGARKVAGI